MVIKNVKFIGKYIIKSKIKAETGIHIGTASSVMEIGGVDNPVIKDAKGIPYIPGSSLKGKMRALMEYYEGLVGPKGMIWTKKEEISIHMCGEEDCPVCNLFGRNHGEHDGVNGGKLDFTNSVIPTRLIVRDAFLDSDSITEEMHDNMDLEWTEVKFENNIDRITSKAHPRQTERVPAGAQFDSEIILNVFEVEGVNDDKKYLKKLITAMKLLEDDYLGGQGSRGYGKIRFKNITVKFRGKEYYEDLEDEETIVDKVDTLDDVIKKIEG